MSTWRYRTLAFVITSFFLAAPAWADFSGGVAAYNRGDYATTIECWK